MFDPRSLDPCCSTPLRSSAGSAPSGDGALSALLAALEADTAAPSAAARKLTAGVVSLALGCAYLETAWKAAKARFIRSSVTCTRSRFCRCCNCTAA